MPSEVYALNSFPSTIAGKSNCKCIASKDSNSDSVQRIVIVDDTSPTDIERDGHSIMERIKDWTFITAVAESMDFVIHQF